MTRVVGRVGLIGAMIVQPLCATIGAQQFAPSRVALTDQSRESRRDVPAARFPYESDRKQQPKPPGDHRFRYVLSGAAIGAAMAFAYYKASDNGRNSGTCRPFNCALPYLSLSGGIFGLFLAQEKGAQRRAEMPRAGEALTFRYTEISLPAPALALATSDSFVVAATDSGVQLMSAGPRSAGLIRRGAGLRDIRSVAMGASAAAESGAPAGVGNSGIVSLNGGPLYIGTAVALWETPLTAGLLSRTRGGAVDALAAHGDVVVSATGATIHVRRSLRGAVRTDTIASAGAVTAIEWDATAAHWWVTTAAGLFALTTGDSTRVGDLELRQVASYSGTSRSIAVSPQWVAVALGSDGLVVWPRAALTSGKTENPIVFRGEPRFVFGAAFVGNTVYVAGGVDGVTQIELSPTARIVGSSRQAGYATAIRAENGIVWVGDRNGNRVLRITP